MEERGDKFRDTMVATLVGDGSWVPPMFIKGEVGNAPKSSGRRPLPHEKPVKGMNNAKMKEYGDHLNKFIDRPTVLIMDRLASHTSKEVRQYLEAFVCSDGSQKFETLLLPPKTAFLISPCDMGFFAMWKSEYYKYNRSTYQLKVRAANEVWKKVSPDKVANFFVHCGLTSKESAEALQVRLLKEVRGDIPEKLQRVYEFYQNWLKGSIDVPGAHRPRAPPTEEMTIPEDSGLDGVYWINKGPHKGM